MGKWTIEDGWYKKGTGKYWYDLDAAVCLTGFIAMEIDFILKREWENAIILLVGFLIAFGMYVWVRRLYYGKK